jgi:hypothetical protein
MAMITLQEFCSDASMLLRDQPRGAAARLSQHVIAWWSGHAIVFAYLREDNETLIEEEFDPGDLRWDDWADAFQRWLALPAFERFDEIERWIRKSPPFESGRID